MTKEKSYQEEIAEDRFWTLPVAFFFSVTIDDEEYAFKEVSGLDCEIEVETIREGGTNEFEYKLPKQVRYSNLVLKRAQLPLDSLLIHWVKNVIEEGFMRPILTRNISIKLLETKEKSLYNWDCIDAYPVKWSIEPLDSEKNTILIETIEFAYKGIKRSS